MELSLERLEMDEHTGILNARRIYYLLLSHLFLFSEDDDRYDEVLNLLNIIKQSPINDQCSKSIEILLIKFQKQNIHNIIQEYDDIFHAPPYAIHNTFSFYEEGYEAGNACARVRRILAKTNIRRNEHKFKENEDSVGFCFTLMQEFLNSEILGDDSIHDISNELFLSVINPSIDEFISALYEHKNSDVYAEVCAILQSFMQFERVFLNAPKPQRQKTLKTEGMARSQALIREQNRRARRLTMQINLND